MLTIIIVSIIIEILVLLRFKSIALQIIIGIAILPQITLFAFSFGFPVPGVLSLRQDIFSPKAITIANISLLISSWILILVLYPLRNRTYHYNSFKCTKTSYLILLLIAFICAICSYPRVSGLNFRFDLSTIFISTNVAMFLCRYPRSHILTILHIALLIWVIIGGDRVDSMASIIFLLIFTSNNNYHKESVRYSILIFGVFVLFTLGIISGLLRNGLSFSPEALLYSLYAQQTVSDIVYVFLCSIEYVIENGPNPAVLLNMLLGLFPGIYYGAVSEYNYTIFLNHNFAPNPGGGWYVSEGIIAFGFLGTFIYVFIYASIIKALFIRHGNIATCLFILFVVMSFRMQWYGMIYCYKPVIFSIIYCLVFIYMAKIRKKTPSIDPPINTSCIK